MKTTDTSETGLETLIIKSLIEESGYQAEVIQKIMIVPMRLIWPS